jgi:hypothetical protein
MTPAVALCCRPLSAPVRAGRSAAPAIHTGATNYRPARDMRIRCGRWTAANTTTAVAQGAQRAGDGPQLLRTISASRWP